MLSPATVEMGGVCALPVKKDFDRLTAEDIATAYEEVTLPKEQFNRLCDALATSLASC